MAESVYKIYILNENNTQDNTELKINYDKVSKLAGKDIPLKKEDAINLYSTIVLKCLETLGYDASGDTKSKVKKVAKDVAKDVANVGKELAKDAAVSALDSVFGDTFRVLGGNVLMQAFRNIKFNKSMKYEYNKDAEIKINIYLTSEYADSPNKLKYMVMFDSTRSYNERTNEIKPVYINFNDEQQTYYLKKPSQPEEGSIMITAEELRRLVAGSESKGWSIDITKPETMKKQVESIQESYYVDIVDNGLEKIVMSKKFSDFDSAFKYAFEKSRINRKSINGHVGLDRTVVCLSDDSLNNEPWRVCDKDRIVSRPCKDLKQACNKLEDLIKLKQYGILTKVKKAVICK